MGAAFLLLAMAARQRQLEDERRHREAERRRQESERRRRQEEEERRKRRGSGYYTYSSGKKYSFDEHIRKIVAENPALLDFMEKLYAEGEAIDDADRGEIVSKLDEIAPKALEAQKRIEELKKKVEESGVTVGNEYKSTFMRVDYGEGASYTSQIGSHRYNEVGYPMGFNGIRITRNTLDSDGKDYQDLYDEKLRLYPGIDEKLAKEQRQLARQEALSKMPLMDTYKRMEKIRFLKRDVEDDTRRVEEIAECKKRLDTFKALTPEQKEAIGEYIDEVDKLREMMKPVGEMVGNHRDIGIPYRPINYQRNKWERAFENLKKSGKVSVEVTSQFFEMVARELESVQHSYPDGLSEYSDSAPKSVREKGPLSWIIKHKAIEYARQEKSKAKQEEKVLDNALEAAGKKDDKTQTQAGTTPQGNEDGKGEEGEDYDER